MKLPVPFQPADRLYFEAEGARPKGGALADANKAAEEGNPYQAMLIIAVAGCAALTTSDGIRTEDRGQIRALLGEAPYVDIEYLALKAMVAIGAGDPVEMLLECPTCHEKWKEDSPALDDLPVVYSEIEGIPVVPRISINLEYPIEVTGRSAVDDEKKVLMSAKSLLFEYPTHASAAAALKRIGMSDLARFQYFVWGMSIVEVDGVEVDKKWRLTWWDRLFESMDTADIRSVGGRLTSFGIDPNIDVVCRSCGRQWKKKVPTQDFFVSGLRGAQ